MKVTVNGVWKETSAGTAFMLRAETFPDREVLVLNGFQISEDAVLHDGDHVYIGKKGVFPERDELHALMSARHTPGVHARVSGATVGVAGLGGLGSNIVAMLARLGVGRLVIADFDVIEPTNLNRQNYYVEHIGMSKAKATADAVGRINPFIEVVTHDVRITPDNAASMFGGCDVVCEAFDSPTEKAMIVNTLMEKCPGLALVCGSGLAGFGDSNDIHTVKRMGNLYVCGDGFSAARIGTGLMSPRVGICAGHMANAVLRLLMGEEIR
ncbi:MAG: sulfur carrier protein ThiS adenylyltransferase ThiF [Candidatus Methanoplasma sp.]|jgi:sulfur carrier protein ThiS adenylyltransferase|nr:sulfur carrier protein ThiS adenylyltransferase ThiF [Candidatus Methanoplasma sp.]